MTGAADIVRLVVPAGIHDRRAPSGGNVFDRELAAGLAGLGRDVRILPVDAAFPLERALTRVPDGAPVLVDGLVARAAPGIVEEEARRVRIVVLAHMVSAAFPGADARVVDDERRALRAATGVVATSDWTRAQLVASEVLPPDRVVVAIPGAADAPVAAGTPSGGALLCVGVVAPHKGQDVLLEALASLGEHAAGDVGVVGDVGDVGGVPTADAGPWTCTIAGSLSVSPDYAEHIRARVREAGLDGRIRLTGALTGDELEEAFRTADLLVAPSRTESYGMAIAEALRRGIPILASTAGGIPQTVAHTPAAMLVPPDDPDALRGALRHWLTDAPLRARLKDDAARTRSMLPQWADTAVRVDAALAAFS